MTRSDIANRRPRDTKKEVLKALIGAMVITKYNNKTYRIDDILWDKNPTETFSHRGEEKTLVDYYM